MSLPELFAPAINSPRAMLTAGVGATDTIIAVDNAAKLPEPPNLLTVGTDENAETVKLLSKNGNILSVRRGEQGTAKAWPAGEFIARNFTAKDHADMIAWLIRLNTAMGAMFVFTADCSYSEDDNVYVLELISPTGASQSEILQSLPDLFSVMARFPNAYELDAKFRVGAVVYEPKYAGFEENDVQIITFDRTAQKCFFRVGGGGGAATAAYCGSAFAGITFIG